MSRLVAWAAGHTWGWQERRVLVYFATHSTSTDNEAGVASGHRDAGLSARGRRQAAELGREFANVPLGAVYCSTLRRAIETARIAFGRAHDIRTDQRLNEIDYGDWAGIAASELDTVRARHVDVPFPNGESYRQRAAMVDGFLRDVRLEPALDACLIVGHRATLLSLESLLGGKALEEAVRAPFAWRPWWRYTLTLLS